MAGIFLSQRRRRNVVAAAPDFYLCLAVFGRGFRLVEALQRTIVTFVEAPRPVDRNPQHVHLVERNPERAERALEHRRVGHVELEFLLGHQTTGFARFFATLFTQVDVVPAGEPVFLVPGAFAVSKQDETMHGYTDALSWRMAARPA